MNKQGLFYNFTLTGRIKTLLFSGKDRPPVEVPLTITQERILMMTCQRGSVQMKTLSEEAGLEKGSLTPVVDSLEALGLLQRVRSARDLRSFEVYPTVGGLRQAEIIEEYFDSRMESMLSGLEEGERVEFVAALQTLGTLIPRLKGDM